MSQYKVRLTRNPELLKNMKLRNFVPYMTSAGELFTEETELILSEEEVLEKFRNRPWCKELKDCDPLLEYEQIEETHGASESEV